VETSSINRSRRSSPGLVFSSGGSSVGPLTAGP
jgi:hypothetical protein